MDLSVIKENEQPLLSRKKITAEVSFEKQTPATKDIQAKLASALNIKENLIVVKKVSQEFGSRKAGILAYVYKSEEELKKIEKKAKKKKAEAKEGKKEGEEKKAEKEQEE